MHDERDETYIAGGGGGGGGGDGDGEGKAKKIEVEERRGLSRQRMITSSKLVLAFA
jgi:hypothetical protein